MSLQTIYQDKATQTDQDSQMDILLKAMTTLCLKVDSFELELKELKKERATSQPHDSQYAELCRSEDIKNPELEGDVEKLHKTHNKFVNAATGKASTEASSSNTTNQSTKRQNQNLNSQFTKTFIKNKQPINLSHPTIPSPQTSTYAASLNQNKQVYNHISRAYIQNMYKTQTFLNLHPRSQTTNDPQKDFITQKLQGYNKLIAQPGTSANLVRTCYEYGLLSTVYTADGAELQQIPDLYNAFTIYKRITDGSFFYIRCYSAPAEILYNEIKPLIQVVKIGLTRDMIIPEEIEKQPEIPEVDIPTFFATKRKEI